MKFAILVAAAALAATVWLAAPPASIPAPALENRLSTSIGKSWPPVGSGNSSTISGSFMSANYSRKHAMMYHMVMKH